MNADDVFFSPASETEELVFGSSRPGYPCRSVSAATVLEWVGFMKGQGIDRVVCLLPDIQLSSYAGLLQTYCEMFGGGQRLLGAHPRLHPSE